jgi:NAD(P)H dehydrogenase (quinone)
MAIAITGASGALGRAAAEFVLQSTDPADVVLTTRNPDSLADFASRGASVRRADFSDPASLPTAFAGVDKLLLISTDAGGARLEQHLATIAAASQAGVHHIAYTSAS